MMWIAADVPVPVSLAGKRLRVLRRGLGAMALARGGKTIREVAIPRVDAPNDLRLRMTPVRFKDAPVGDAIIVDPENAIPEIAEHNNCLVLSTGG